MFMPRISVLIFGNCLIHLPDYVDIHNRINASVEFPELLLICDSYQAEITQVVRVFLHVKNSLHSCIYLSFFLIF